MDRKYTRLAAWVLAFAACLILGGQSAFANNQPRVHAAGFYFQFDPANAVDLNGDRIQLGLNGRCNNDGYTSTSPNSLVCNSTRGNLGEFDYHNQFTGLKSHGKINSLVFEPNGDPDCAALVGATGPAAMVKGGGQCTTNCTDAGGSTHTYNFEMTVVDDDDTAATSGNADAVCKVFVSGYDHNHMPTADSNPGGQLQKGDVEVVTSPQSH